MKYSLSAKKWTTVAKLPSGRACAKAVQVGNKLIVTLGTDGTESTPKNLIFDGSKWLCLRLQLEKLQMLIRNN